MRKECRKVKNFHSVRALFLRKGGGFPLKAFAFSHSRSLPLHFFSITKPHVHRPRCTWASQDYCTTVAS